MLPTTNPQKYTLLLRRSVGGAIVRLGPLDFVLALMHRRPKTTLERAAAAVAAAVATAAAAAVDAAAVAAAVAVATLQRIGAVEELSSGAS
eukprot:4660769-Heterocapsa_arctica.AAC.1